MLIPCHFTTNCGSSVTVVTYWDGTILKTSVVPHAREHSKQALFYFWYLLMIFTEVVVNLQLSTFMILMTLNCVKLMRGQQKSVELQEFL